MKINLSHPLNHYPLTYLNGPGLRFALFVQGCPLLCTDDCLNDPLLPMIEKVMVSIEDVLAHILMLKAQFKIEGVTFLGGEPFGQARPLAQIASWLHEHDLTVMTYSGYSLSTLIQNKADGWADLLRHTDILVEGPFVAKYRSGNILWRGSANQRIILLSNTYSTDILNQQALYDANCQTFQEVKFFRHQHITQIHVSNLIALDTPHDIHQPTPPYPIWNPEAEAIKTHKPYVEKGIIAVIDNQSVMFFGHQTKSMLHHITQILAKLGIHTQEDQPIN